VLFLIPLLIIGVVVWLIFRGGGTWRSFGRGWTSSDGSSSSSFSSGSSSSSSTSDGGSSGSSSF